MGLCFSAYHLLFSMSVTAPYSPLRALPGLLPVRLVKPLDHIRKCVIGQLHPLTFSPSPIAEMIFSAGMHIPATAGGASHLLLSEIGGTAQWSYVPVAPSSPDATVGCDTDPWQWHSSKVRSLGFLSWEPLRVTPRDSLADTAKLLAIILVSFWPTRRPVRKKISRIYTEGVEYNHIQCLPLYFRRPGRGLASGRLPLRV